MNPSTAVAAAYDPAEHPEADIQFGVVLFDDVAVCREGWACIAGGQPMRVQSPADLDTGVVWWANADYDQMRETNLNKHAWLRNSSYFRASMKNVMDEWRLGDRPAAEAAEVLAVIAGNTMAMARRVMPARQKFGATALAGDMADLYPAALVPACREEEDALRHALQEWTPVPGVRSPRTAVHLPLRFSRVDHARMLLDMHVPLEGKVEFVPADAMGRDPLQFLFARAMASVARVRVLGAKSDQAEIFAFGAGKTDGGRVVMRNMVSLPELMAMAQVADVAIDAAWLFDGTSACAMDTLRRNDFVEETLLGQLGAVSYSAGLVAENLWAACTKPPPRHKTFSRGRAVTWRQIYVRSLDRVCCYMAASRLTAMGYVVTGYGTGGVRVACEQEVLPQLVSDAFTLGLVVPAGLASQFLDGAVMPGLDPAMWREGQGGVGFLEGVLRSQLDCEALLHLDNLPLLPDHEADAVLADMLS